MTRSLRSRISTQHSWLKASLTSLWPRLTALGASGAAATDCVCSAGLGAGALATGVEADSPLDRAAGAVTLAPGSVTVRARCGADATDSGAGESGSFHRN